MRCSPLPQLYTASLFEEWWALGVSAGATGRDIVATFTRYTAATIADAYARFAPGPVGEVIVGGGGSNNPVLMRALAEEVNERLAPPAPIRVCTHEDVGVSSGAKEGMAFALLGFMAFHGPPPSAVPPVRVSTCVSECVFVGARRHSQQRPLVHLRQQTRRHGQAVSVNGRGSGRAAAADINER